MDELLQRVAELKGMPASLVERSAQARAEKTGTTLEAVLQEWAGEEPPTGGSSPEQSTGESPQAPAEEQPTVDSPQATAQVPRPEAVPVAITTDHLVQLAADAKRMPPKLILSSGTARAEHSNSSLEEVLANWAGTSLEELQQLSAEAPSADSPPAPAEEEQPTGDSPQTAEAAEAAPKAAVAAVAAALTMDELLEKVAEVKGMPASLAKRSAEARSKKTGETVEEVLAEWAGVEPPTADSPPVTAEEEPAGVSSPATAEEEPVTEAAPGPEVIEASPVEVEGPAEDEVPPVVRGGYPKWLAAAFVLIPLLAVAYILVAPNGPECGTAGQLLVDPVTGESLNCDGTEYGDTTIDYFAEGSGLYNQCVACHSADGSGGAGPAFAGGAVLATFPSGSCIDHQDWVRLGTAGWPDTTYGATGKPVGGFGLMPSFASMTDEDIASVVLYERVQFGGQPLDEALTDCGLDEPDGEGGASTEAAGS